MTYKDNKLPNYKILISDQILYEPNGCQLQIGCKGELDKQCKVFEGTTGSTFTVNFSYCSDGCDPIEQSYQKVYYSFDGITWGIFSEGNVQPGNGFVGFWIQAHIFPKICKIQWFGQEETFYISTDKFGWVCAKNLDPSLGCIQQIGGKYNTIEECETDMNCHPTTTVTPTVTPTTAPTVTPTITPTTIPTTTPTVTPPPAGTSNLVIIGILAVAGIGIWYYMLKKKRKTSEVIV